MLNKLDREKIKKLPDSETIPSAEMMLLHLSTTHSEVMMLSVDSTCPHSTTTDLDQLLPQQWP